MLESVSYDTSSGFGSRVIKRYSNRKLYDTKSSRYVTLLQIAQMVRSGEEVQIIDNRTKEDKTEVTLALIISEELKNSPGGIPLTTLKALIRHDSTPPPSGEQPTFAGARLLGLLGVSEVHAPRTYPVGVGSSAELSYPFAGASEEAFAEHQESSMSGPSSFRQEGYLANEYRPEGGRVGVEPQEERPFEQGQGELRPGEQRQVEQGQGELRPGGRGHGEQRQVELRQFEQWRSDLEARVSRLPDTQAVVELHAQLQRLDERVAELEQRLSKSEE